MTDEENNKYVSDILTDLNKSAEVGKKMDDAWWELNKSKFDLSLYHEDYKNIGELLPKHEYDRS